MWFAHDEMQRYWPQKKMETLRLKVSYSDLQQRRSSLFHKLRLEAHGAKSINLARDVVFAVNDANVFDLGTRFHRFGSSFDRQIFDHHHGVTADQDLAIHILYGAVFQFHNRCLGNFLLIPSMAALGTIQQGAVVV